MAQPDRDTRARLLDAATEVFVEEGYRDAGIREISRRAGVNIAAVNYHFGGKEELYREVLTRAYELASLRPMPRLAERPEAPAECLRLWIEWNLERMLGHTAQEVFGVLLERELRQPSAAFDSLVKHSMQPTWMGLVEIVAAILGRDRDDRDVELAAMSVFGQCLVHKTARPILRRIKPQGHVTESAALIAEHVTTFTLAGLEAIRRGEETRT